MTATIPQWIAPYLGAALSIVQATTNTTASISTSYICNSSTPLQITLPSASLGNRVQIIALGSGGFQIIPALNQIVIDGATGTYSTPTSYFYGPQYTVVDLEYTATNTWQIIAGRGSVTLNQSQITDPFWNNVTVYFPLNNSVVDLSNNGLIATNTSVTFTNTINIYQTYSAVFNGTSAYLTGATSSATKFIGDFTIEFWINPSSVAASNHGILDIRTANDTGGFVIGSYSTYISLWNSGGSVLNGSGALLSVGTWSHVAVTKTGTLVSIFVNGILNVSASISATYAEGGLLIGKSQATEYFAGNIAGLRISNGIARYTSNFTIPSVAFPTISEQNTDPFYNNVNLLLPLNNSIVDLSGNSSVQTITNNNSNVTFNNVMTPIPNSYYAVFNNPTLTFLSTNSTYVQPGLQGPYTFECYVRFNSVNSTTQIIFWRSGSANAWNGTSGIQWQLSLDSTNKFLVKYCTGGSGLATLTSGITPISNTWYHLAVTYDGTTTTMYVNGQLSTNGTSVYSATSTPTVCMIGAAVDNSGQLLGNILGIRYTTRVRYSGNFTPPSITPSVITSEYDPLYKDVTFMPRATSNNQITDYSGNNLTITNTSVTTTTTGAKQDAYAMVFNGSSSNLAVASTMYAFTSTTSFTIEAWIYPTANGESNSSAIFGHQVAGGLGLLQNVNNTIYVSNMQVVTVVTSTASVTLNQWSHVACVRNGGYTTIYINGVASGSAADANAYTLVNPVYVGTDANVASSYFTGNMAGIRITKGYARYTANFTPPTNTFMTIGSN